MSKEVFGFPYQNKVRYYGTLASATIGRMYVINTESRDGLVLVRMARILVPARIGLPIEKEQFKLQGRFYF